jgi:hypothetical protein
MRVKSGKKEPDVEKKHLILFFQQLLHISNTSVCKKHDG